jgi:hypothetical protein
VRIAHRESRDDQHQTSRFRVRLFEAPRNDVAMMAVRRI